MTSFSQCFTVFIVFSHMVFYTYLFGFFLQLNHLISTRNRATITSHNDKIFIKKNKKKEKKINNNKQKGRGLPKIGVV